MAERMRRFLPSYFDVFYFFLEKFNFDWNRAWEVFSNMTEEQLISIREELKRQKKIIDTELKIMQRKLKIRK